MTTPAYEGYAAKALQQSIAAVAASATFASLIDAAPVVPADRIVEIDGGLESETSPRITASTGETFPRATTTCWAHVWPMEPEFSTQWLAQVARAHDGSSPIALYFRCPAGLKRHEQLRYALSKTGLISADIEALAGTAGYWRRIVCLLAGLQLLDLSGYGKGLVRTHLNLQYGDLA